LLDRSASLSAPGAEREEIMSELTLLQEPTEQEIDDIGSYNHSTVQANLAYLLKRIGKYSVAVELSLDSSNLEKRFPTVSDELIPDLCVYPLRQLIKSDDILKMTEMPLIAIEVLSFRQFPSTLIEKFKAYFALGIQSCWLIDPLTQSVHVYSAIDQWKTFGIDDELVVDEFEVRFPVSEVFAA
jgi:Uma2 family endonuclease